MRPPCRNSSRARSRSRAWFSAGVICRYAPISRMRVVRPPGRRDFQRLHQPRLVRLDVLAARPHPATQLLTGIRRLTARRLTRRRLQRFQEASRTASATFGPIAFLRHPFLRARAQSPAPSPAATPADCRYSKIRSSSPASTGTLRQISSGNSANELRCRKPSPPCPAPARAAGCPSSLPPWDSASSARCRTPRYTRRTPRSGVKPSTRTCVPEPQRADHRLHRKFRMRLAHQDHLGACVVHATTPAKRAQRFGDALVRLQKSETRRSAASLVHAQPLAIAAAVGLRNPRAVRNARDAARDSPPRASRSP